MEISAEDRVMDTAGEIARLSYTLVWVGRFQDKKNAGRSGREPEVEEVSTEEGRPLYVLLRLPLCAPFFIPLQLHSYWKVYPCVYFMEAFQEFRWEKEGYRSRSSQDISPSCTL